MPQRFAERPLYGFAIFVVILCATVHDAAMAQAAGSDPTQPRAIENPQGGDVQQMLDQADAYKRNGLVSRTEVGRNLVGPPGENAAELYWKVLAIDPGNQRARQGLQDIAAFFVSIAQRNCDQTRFSACKVAAEQGLRAAPDDTHLKALARQADDAMRGAKPDR